MIDDFRQEWIDSLTEQYEEADAADAPIGDSLDEEAIIALLILFAQMGQRLAESQLDDLIGGNFEDDLAAWAGDRVDSLIGRDTSPEGLYYPLAPQSLDIQSERDISSALGSAVVASGMVASRSQLLAFNEAIVAHSFGQFKAAERLGAQWKTWLRTTSANERPDHLAIVGERVRFRDNFSTGEFWSQLRIGCQCGVMVSRV